MKPILFATALVTIACASLANAATKKVPQNFATIGDAVSAAVSGDTIQISPNTASGSHGVYTENVTVPSTTTGLKFIGKNNPTWDGTENSQLVITGPANDNVRIDGITFRNGKAQVVITGDHATVEDCRFLSSLAQNSVTIDGDFATVRACEVDDCFDYGIDITGTDSLVTQCTFRRIDFPGVILTTGDRGRVVKNDFFQCCDAITVESGDDIEISGNHIVEDACGGIEFTGDRITVRKNTVRIAGGNYTSGDGFGIKGKSSSDDCVIEKNTIEKTNGTGIEVDGTNAHIAQNKLTTVNNGIAVFNGSSASADGPTITGNQVNETLGQDHGGIAVFADEFTINDNVIETVLNYQDGIFVEALALSTQSGTISGNVVKDCIDAGVLVLVSNVEISDNAVSACGQGYDGGGGFVIESAGCTLTDNTAKHIAADGFVVTPSTGPIDSNSFIRCVAIDCANDGFDIEAGANTSLDQCTAKNCLGEGLDVSVGTSASSVTNSTFKKCRIDFAGNSLLATSSGNTFDTGGDTTAPEVDFD